MPTMVDAPDRIEIFEHETAALIRSATGRPLVLTFGSHVWLDARQSSWAVPIIEKLRGITIEEGAGI